MSVRSDGGASLDQPLDTTATAGLPALLLADTPTPIGGFVRVDGITAKFYRNEEPDYKTWLELRLRIPNQPVPEDDNQAEHVEARIRFGARTLIKDLLLHQVTPEEIIPPAISQLPRVETSHANGSLYTIGLRFHPANVTWIGYKAKHPRVSAVYKEQLDALASAVGSGTFTFYCRSNQDFTYQLESLNTALNEERSQRDPIWKWHTSKRRAFIQLGAEMPQDERPSVKLPPQLAFENFEEYLTIQGYGVIQEAEYSTAVVEQWKTGTHGLKLLTIPGAGNRRYIGFLTMEANQARLNPRDRVDLKFIKHSRAKEDAWSAFVTESLPMVAVGQVTLIVNRPRDQEDQSKFVTMEVETGSGEVNLVSDLGPALARTPVNTVEIGLIRSDQTLKRQIKSLRTITDSPAPENWNRHLIGQDLVPRSHVDIYEGLSGIEPSPGLSSSQRRLHDYCRALPDGIGLVTGPPGTGKTHAIVQLIMPFLATKGSDYKVLIGTPSNEPTDVVVNAIAAEMEKQPACENAMVIRFHSASTEQDVVWSHARENRTEPLHPIVPIISEADISTLVADMEAAMLLKSHFLTHTTRPSPYSRDVRFRLAKHSLGMWMLRVSGLISGFEKHTEPNRWADFCEMYRQYQDDTFETPDDTIRFRASIKELQLHVLQKADVIVTTLSNCADPSLAEKFRPRLVFVDEAARANELDILHVVANYKPQSTILVGDDNQLRPTVLTVYDGQNGFAQQLTLSLFARLKRLGKESILLREQYRMAKGLAGIPSECFYAGRLIDGPGTAMEDRPLSQEWTKFLGTAYGIRNNMILLDVRGSTCNKNPTTTSRSNNSNAVTVIGLLREAFGFGILGKHIAIATPYQGQYEVYRAALIQLARKFPQAKNVDVRKIDGYQGGEATYVILDLVVTTNLGFAADPNRLNVGLTRCRDGLVVVGDVGSAESMPRRSGKHYQRVLDLFNRTSSVLTIDASTIENDPAVLDYPAPEPDSYDNTMWNVTGDQAEPPPAPQATGDANPVPTETTDFNFDQWLGQINPDSMELAKADEEDGQLWGGEGLPDEDNGDREEADPAEHQNEPVSYDNDSLYNDPVSEPGPTKSPEPEPRPTKSPEPEPRPTESTELDWSFGSPTTSHHL